MWGGRFASGPAAIMAEINASIDFDRRLYKQDIAGSRAHCNMLMAQGIISNKDGHAILRGLDTVETEIAGGNFAFDRALEDIHMHVEARLHQLIGDAAGRLHTARSRNDQVATDLKLWLRDRLDELGRDLAGLQRALVAQAEIHVETVMPGFTHLQVAQPVTLGHYLLAYFEMFDRDRTRALDCRKRLNECPLGAAALAGTSFPVDRRATARALGFARPSANSLDAVSDRDFVIEFLSVANLTGLHLSRLAEELVLWSSPGFGFIALSDQLTTGSSIMPQKRNPDAAELIRAKTGRLLGALTSFSVTLKALPLAYAKDMQEDKEPVFDAADTLTLCVAAMTEMLGDMTVNVAAMRAAAEHGFATATDLADWLVRKLDLPFRKAHEITGRIVRLADDRGDRLAELTLEDLQRIEPRITGDVFAVLTVENSVASRTSLGGTAPRRVREALKRARKKCQ
ncbi:MAG: argininosuccinate lyase [Proteobacteria bacterium]|nr:argininosuccinate lyase [Pseudomonadota bacterium]